MYVRSYDIDEYAIQKGILKAIREQTADNTARSDKSLSMQRRFTTMLMLEVNKNRLEIRKTGKFLTDNSVSCILMTFFAENIKKLLAGYSSILLPRSYRRGLYTRRLGRRRAGIVRPTDERFRCCCAGCAGFCSFDIITTLYNLLLRYELFKNLCSCCFVDHIT